RLKMFLSEAARSLTTNVSTTIAATLTVLIAMFLFGLVIALGSWVNSYTGKVKEGVVVKVFFDQTASEQQLDAVRARLVADPDVKGVDLVTKEEALELMRRRAPELTRNLTSNPFGHAFTVIPKDANQVSAIADRLEPAPVGVDKVTYEEETTERVLLVAKVLGIIILTGSILLLVASTILIANTIRLSIYARRREIEVMKLVGATNWFVRGPFMLEGVICGLVGSLVAVILLLVAKRVALDAIPVLDRARADADALAFPLTALILIGLSLLIGAAGSGVTLHRFLRV
ncbi:MAG: permease-like cell division protein FtsX, partial [Gaiellales bacterium]